MLVRLSFVAAALCWRAPFFPFTDLNADESLYRLIGGAWLQGQMPYVGMWDRKPAGLFLVHAGLAALPVDQVFAAHVTAAAFVGLGAACLYGIARMLFPAAGPVGLVAGLAYIVFSVRNGGQGLNAELLFGPLNLAGFWVLLRSRLLDRHPNGHGGAALALLAGLLLGAAAQMKYNAALEWPAFAAAALLLRPSGWRLPALACVTGTLLPSLGVMGWYWGAGHLGDWFEANIIANLALFGGGAPPFQLRNLPFLAGQYDVLGAGLALAAAAALWQGGRSELRRGVAAVAIWLLCAVLALLVMRRFANHMMLQLLPPLALAAGFGAVQSVRILAPPGRRRLALGALLAAACLAWEGRGAVRPFLAAAELASHRRAEPNWGDPSATAGAALRRVLGPEDGIYVFGLHQLGIYQAAGRMPPTRFPFPEHLWEGYAPVDGMQELDSILARRPAFILVAAGWAPGQAAPDPAAAPVFARLHAALAASYVPEATVNGFTSRGGGPIGPREAILVFRRQDRAPAASAFAGGG